ncbi:hypothetical protein C0J52_05899 [Blattella germanica]|nr:hypothetical protein C0J52_05899 [Blattella germanica]
MERIHRQTRQSMHGIHNLKKLLACAKRIQLGALQHHKAIWSVCDNCTNGAHKNLHIEPAENFQCHNQLNSPLP